MGHITLIGGKTGDNDSAMTIEDPEANKKSFTPIFQYFTFSKSQILKGLKNMSLWDQSVVADN